MIEIIKLELQGSKPRWILKGFNIQHVLNWDELKEMKKAVDEIFDSQDEKEKLDISIELEPHKCEGRRKIRNHGAFSLVWRKCLTLCKIQCPICDRFFCGSCYQDINRHECGKVVSE